MLRRWTANVEQVREMPDAALDGRVVDAGQQLAQHFPDGRLSLFDERVARGGSSTGTAT